MGQSNRKKKRNKKYTLPLKTLGTLVIVKDQSSHLVGVSQRMHKITNLWKYELNWSSKLQDNNERKNTLVTRSYVLSDAWFRDLNILFWGLEIKFVEITSFSNTTPLQREPFLTMFYTINSSPLHVTKECFMLSIFLSICTLSVLKLAVVLISKKIVS